MNSPLGKYRHAVAALSSVVVIASYIAALALQVPGAADIAPIAYIAMVAVFGTAMAAAASPRKP